MPCLIYGRADYVETPFNLLPEPISTFRSAELVTDEGGILLIRLSLSHREVDCACITRYSENARDRSLWATLKRRGIPPGKRRSLKMPSLGGTPLATRRLRIDDEPGRTTLLNLAWCARPCGGNVHMT